MAGGALVMVTYGHKELDAYSNYLPDEAGTDGVDSRESHIYDKGVRKTCVTMGGMKAQESVRIQQWNLQPLTITG